MLNFEFIGRLHPLMVHLPIGILLFAFAIIIFQRFRRVDMGAAVSFALLLGGMLAAVACVTSISKKEPLTVPQIIEQNPFIYRDKIAPILESKCYGCHSAIKKKGGLRLDSEAFIQEGGKSGSVLTAGNPEKSPLFTNLLLPEDDDDHMPPKGKPQLSEQEIATIHYWIKNGASFQEVVEKMEVNSQMPLKTTEVSALNLFKVQKTSAKDSSKTVITPTHESKATIERIPKAEAKILKIKVEAATPSVLTALKQQNISVSNFGEGSNYLSANFVNVKNYSSNSIDALNTIGNQLVTLKLSNQPVTDADVKKLSAFKNLTSLNLDKTAITDAALKHLKNLPNLEQLNLYGTKITDAGLSYLVKCNKLTTIYLWQTKTTTAGIEQLKKALPNVQIEAGGFQFPKRDTSKNK